MKSEFEQICERCKFRNNDFLSFLKKNHQIQIGCLLVIDDCTYTIIKNDSALSMQDQIDHDKILRDGLSDKRDLFLFKEILSEQNWIQLIYVHDIANNNSVDKSMFLIPTQESIQQFVMFRMRWDSRQMIENFCDWVRHIYPPKLSNYSVLRLWIDFMWLYCYGRKPDENSQKFDYISAKLA